MSAKEYELSDDGLQRLGSFVLHGYLEMLNAIAGEIARPELAQGSDSERPGLVRRELEKSCALLILDNLDALPRPDQDQCFAFLGRLPGSCSAIVTSRRSRTDVPAAVLHLDQLGEMDAKELIKKLALQHPRLQRVSAIQQHELYVQTGGNPLLIRWVAGQLGRGSCPTIDSALSFLKNAPPGNDPLEYIFGDLLETFSSNESLLLAVLSYYAGAMDVKLICDLAGVSEQVGQAVLGTLSTRALVIPDVEERRFSLAPMVAAFLRNKRPELVEHMGRQVEARAYDLILQNGYLQHARYPTLEAAWPIVVAALPLFLAGENDRLQRICDALHIFLEFTGHWDEWLSLNEKAEQRAINEGDYFEAGWRALQAGRVHRLRHQADAVFACADRAEAHWAKTRSPDYTRSPRADSREDGDAHTLRGKGHHLREEFRAAIDCFTTARDVLKPRYRLSRDYTSALNGLADAERRSGNFEQAEALYKDALAIAREINSPNDIAAYTGNLAALAIDRHDYPLAEHLAREALILAEAVGRQESIAADYRRLSEACAGQEKFQDGRMYAMQAAEIYDRLGSPYARIAESMRNQWKT